MGPGVTRQPGQVPFWGSDLAAVAQLKLARGSLQFAVICGGQLGSLQLLAPRPCCLPPSRPCCLPDSVKFNQSHLLLVASRLQPLEPPAVGPCLIVRPATACFGLGRLHPGKVQYPVGLPGHIRTSPALHGHASAIPDRPCPAHKPRP